MPHLHRGRALGLILDFLGSLPDGRVTLTGSRAAPLMTGAEKLVPDQRYMVPVLSGESTRLPIAVK